MLFNGQLGEPVTEQGPALDAARAASPVQWVLTKLQGQDLIPARFSSMQCIMNCTSLPGRLIRRGCHCAQRNNTGVFVEGLAVQDCDSANMSITWMNTSA